MSISSLATKCQKLIESRGSMSLENHFLACREKETTSVVSSEFFSYTAGENPKYGSELWCHLVDVSELFFELFFNGNQWGKIFRGRILKIQNHGILDMCPENVFTKFGWYRSKIDKIKSSQSFTYKTYINTIISHIMAPPCVKLHVQLSPALIY